MQKLLRRAYRNGPLFCTSNTLMLVIMNTACEKWHRSCDTIQHINTIVINQEAL